MPQEKRPDLTGLMKEKNKLMLVSKSPITTKQVLKIFQRTPAQHIHRRPAKGGGEWDYVTGVYVKKVLNYVFGWLWDFEIKNFGREGDQCWVLGKLTIKKSDGSVLIVKEQFGRADVKFKKETKTPLDYGNDLKAAATDALKKCASEIGVASDVYGKNEFKELGVDLDRSEKDPNSPFKSGEKVAGECHECGRPLTKAEVVYSMRIYKKPLCREDQKNKK